MEKQQVPLIEFEHFTLGQISGLFKSNKIHINKEYQRGDVWKEKQKTELIKSIANYYPIGVLVVYRNEAGQYEILDGQQRLLAMKAYVDGEMKLEKTDLIPYNELDEQKKHHVDSYSIYYLKLMGIGTNNKEEDVIQTFLRLQEGTPLNKAEKICAHGGAYVNAFKKIRDDHDIFKKLGFDKRFRLRLLAAEMLLIELESDFECDLFPSLELGDHIVVLKKYSKTISQISLTFYIGTLDLLHASLTYLLTALKPRDVLAFYLLLSWLRKRRAGNQNIVNEFFAFAKEFMKNLSISGIYKKSPPKGMPRKVFDKYQEYKFQSKIMTSPDSIKKRLVFMREEFARLKKIIEKDKKRYHDEEQKRLLYFHQKGLCPVCGKPMDFKNSTADHMIAHSDGGRTDNLTEAQLVHWKCHKKLESSRKLLRIVKAAESKVPAA